MADDLAFLFADPEQAGGPVRRTRQTTPSATPHPASPPPSEIDWVTLREAHMSTSIPISTLRKWAKKGKVRGRLTRSEGRDLRLLAMSDVLSRAAQLGRAIQPVEPEVTVDLRQEEVATVEVGEMAEPTAAASPAAEAGDHDGRESRSTSEEAVTPDGSILVPLDAWERMLGQLGNLHEAGQQLADARERAAKAETEVEFLRERMRELRKRAEEAELAADLTQQQSALPMGPVVSEKPFQARWRHWLDSWFK